MVWSAPLRDHRQSPTYNPPANIDTESEKEDLIQKVESYVNIVISDKEYKDLDSYEWVADSASTVHITHQRDAFATYGPVPKIEPM